MLNVKAVIFDMDGLMIDTEPVGKMLVKKSHEKFGYDVSEEMFSHLIGSNEQSAKNYYESVFGKDYPYYDIKAYRDELRKEYFSSHKLEVKKGLYDFLAYLKDKGIKMAVASSTRYERVVSNLKEVEVYDYFDVIVGGDQVENGKPAPDIFLKAASMLGVNNDEAVVLEDSKNGILAAYSGKIPVICIPDLIYHSEDIMALTVGVYNSLDELIGVIG